jgi:phosphoenolpyruvate carboxykinase (GTP)
MGKKIAASPAELPKIFCVNWFRTDENGKFVWPGFGDNMRVLKWMLDRIEGKAGGVEHIFGTTPRFDDLTWDGADFNQAQFDRITSIDTAAWEEELKLHAELFDKLKHKLPKELESTMAYLEKRLAA